MSFFDDSPKREPDYSAREALDYSERIGQQHLQRIDWMHQRFLWFIGAIVAILGFVGYAKLNSIATEAARLEARKAARMEVEAKFKREGVDQLITELVNEKAGAALDNRVQAAVTAKVDPAIRAAVELERNRIEAQVRAEFAQQKPTAVSFNQLPAEMKKPITFVDYLSGAPLSQFPTPIPGVLMLTIHSDNDQTHQAFARWIALQFVLAKWPDPGEIINDLPSERNGIVLHMPPVWGGISGPMSTGQRRVGIEQAFSTLGISVRTETPAHLERPTSVFPFRI